MRGRRLSHSNELPAPNNYVSLLLNEFSPWAFDEQRAPQFRNQWREQVFKVPAEYPLDLEIGTGNGFHFAYRAKNQTERALLGIEIKYKPLIQTIRRAVREGSTNVRIIRYNAALLRELFAPEELNDILIHFPDPWPKKKHFKHRLIQDDFLQILFDLQRPGSIVEFKTDNRDYFEWTMERVLKSKYEVTEVCWDLHDTKANGTTAPVTERTGLLQPKDLQINNGVFTTHFEQIFLRQGLPIMRSIWRKPSVAIIHQ